MPTKFPPTPLYPDFYDSDYSLFKVYNTTETVTSVDNYPWSEEIEIVPVLPTASEIWPDNGYATISGELLYYDSVEKNAYDKVIKLKGCVRNLAGSYTSFNAAGTDIRGFVVAEHHNQIAKAIIQIEQYLGVESCEETDALTCCLNEINLPINEEDSNCPDVVFDYTTETSSEYEGTILNYKIQITGNYSSFRLDFGDGTYTTSPQNGQKKYAIGANIDPTITITNNLCEIVLTGTFRVNFDDEPTVSPTTSDLTIPVVIPTMPTIDVTMPEIPVPEISIPPIITPYIDFETISFAISGGPFDIPSVITISGDIPSDISLIVPVIPNISVTVPTFPDIVVIDSIPTSIYVDASDLPDVISVTLDSPIPDTITITGDIPSVISVEWDQPVISVDWSGVPSLTCDVNINCPSSCGGSSMRELADIDDLDGISLANFEVDYQFAGIPSEITVKPLDINVNTDTIPREILLKSDFINEIKIQSPDIPSIINIQGSDIPSEIKVIAPKEFPKIDIDTTSIPSSIPIDWGNFPTEISVVATNLPSVIQISHDIPSIITVEGMVDTITVKGWPDFIPLKLENPEDLVLRVEPAEVKVVLDKSSLLAKDEEGRQCFALVPCN